MKRMMILSAAAAAMFGGELAASASDTFVEFIPASACQIEFEEDIGKLELVDGSWVMNSGLDDSVSLLCPIRMPYFVFVTGTAQTMIWTGINMFFRDPDGTAGNHEVEVELIRNITTGAFEDVLYTMSSNSMFPSVTTNTYHEEDMSLFFDDLVDAQHYGRITMTQDGGTTRATFTRLALFAIVPI